MVVSALLIVGAGSAAWWWYPSSLSPDVGPELAGRRVPTLLSDRPETQAPTQPRPGVTEKGDTAAAHPTPPVPNSKRARQLLAAGRKALASNEWVPAREHFNEAIATGLAGAELDQARADLTRINMETVFSPRVMPEDTLVGRHIIQPGETLGVIAKKYAVSDDFLARINNIKDKNRIRGGQTIKVVNGPFHVVVDVKRFTLSVYLGQGSERTLMKQFSVGLGRDRSTPIGMWRVRNKLVNPTYYPPRGGLIIAADDPKNPLGERWIGLQGVSGDALGQERYGIHGTIDPASIGQNASMGCIRLYNEDVEELFDLLIPGKSTIEVR